jgi:hypothetical protein
MMEDIIDCFINSVETRQNRLAGRLNLMTI